MNPKDFYLEVQKGNIAGHSIVHKFGANVNVPNGTWALISSSSPSGAFPSSGSPVRIKAGGNVADIINGAGAREITILGMTTDLEEATEIISTSGANASLYTTNSFWRIYRAYVTDVGTYGGTNVGEIILENGQDMLFITADEGQTQHTAFSIPAGKTGYLLSTHINVDAAKAADCRMYIRENLTNTTSPMSPKRLHLYWNGALGEVKHSPNIPCIVIQPLSDIWIEARGGGANTEVSANFEILLVDDEVSHIRSV